MTDKSSPRLLFYFMHLLGVGHVFRAKRLIEGFAREGIAVDIIYGGLPVETDFQANSIFYLPPVQVASADYSQYLDANGEPLSQQYMDDRKERLLQHFKTLSPDMILIEAYPFGRRVVRHELAAMIDAARQRVAPPIIVSSVRDILQEGRKPGRNEQTRDIILENFDYVLVHSDPNVIELDETFPFANDISDKLTYTGFVVPPGDAISTNIDSFDIIVSAGGGAFGGELMATALETARQSSFPEFFWCLTTGPNLSEKDFSKLKDTAPENVTVRRRLENLAAHLTKAKVSVSQCGYNTAMDTLRAHESSDCRAVYVPYDTTGQTEQIRRAGLLEKSGFGISLPQSELTPSSLVDAITSAMELPRAAHTVDFAGVNKSAKIIAKWLAEREQT